MARSLTSKNLLEKKSGAVIKIDHPILSEAIGEAELKGCWLIYGSEKNGKTWLTLKLAKAIAPNHKIDYISAEEGIDKSFREACTRAGINKADKINWNEEIPIAELIEKYKKPKTAQVIVLDNLSCYIDDFRKIAFRELLKQLPNKLIICVAHEERKEPFPAVAKQASKFAKVIINVKGLKGFVTSRFSKGGEVVIDEDKSELYWGSK